jgi:hypothetical protein
MAFEKRSGAGALSRVDKKSKFFFLHGDDEAAIERAKDQIISAHLSREEREENYFEIIPTGNPPQLRKVLDDVLAELSTVSFLPDVTRIVTMYTVSDFFDGKSASARRGRGKKKAEADEPSKKTYSDHLAAFLQAELPSLPAVLIIIALEDYEKFKRVSTTNPVVQFAQSRSAAYCFKEESPQFLFFDALFARQTTRALELWREWHRRAPGSPRPAMMLASQLRHLIQAKTATSPVLKQRGLTRAEYSSKFMPHENDKNMFALRPDFRQEKLLRASAAFSFTELLDAYEKLMDIQKFAIPTASDLYVPDRELLAETWILDFTIRK